MALDVDRIDVDGVWYRHLPHRGSVWWRSEPPPDGRWQRGSAIAGFYLADSRETAWAEWYRQIDELALRPADQLPRDLWRFEVDVDEIADLRSESQLARVGLAVPLPRRHGWPAFQKIGEQLHAEGKNGPYSASRAAISSSVASRSSLPSIDFHDVSQPMIIGERDLRRTRSRNDSGQTS